MNHSYKPQLEFFGSSRYDALLKLIRPLIDSFGLDLVLLTKISEDGSFYQLSNFPELAEVYWDNGLYKQNPFFYAPSNYKPGTVILTDHPSEEFHEAQQQVKKYYNSSCVFGHFMPVDDELYWVGLSSRSKKLPLFQLIVTERVLLEKFAKHLIGEWKRHETKMDPFTVDMKKLLGEEKFLRPRGGYRAPTIEQRAAFLKRVGLLDKDFLLPRFTRRERQCLSYLMQGKTVPQIAEMLHLSPRTIEYYIENLKNKMGVSLKSQIIEKGLFLKEVGLLSDSA